MIARTIQGPLQGPLILSLSKDTRGIGTKLDPHRVCFDRLSMSGQLLLSTSGKFS